jgi:radical SAM superfamily enzyme YgiQ (UPF0313 family)
MRIAFIKPNMGLVGGKPYYDNGRMEPLTFAVLAGLTPPQHEVELYDDRFEAIPFDEPYDLVGINTEIYTARRAYEIADAFRERGVQVVLGGYHTTMLPEESMAHADAVMVGDAEGLWPQVLHDAERRQLDSLYTGAPRQGPSLINQVKTDWSIFDGKSYLSVRLTQFSRGCPNWCEYCATGNIYRRTHHHRSAEDVVGELRRDGSRLVFFVDDNIVADPEASRKLFRALIPLRIRWFSQASLNFSNDPELMDLMLESGCCGLVVGFESLDPKNLQLMKKNCNLQYESYDAAVESIRQAGLLIWAAFLVGYDNETVESIRATVDWALSKKFAFSAFNILMPYPSTPFYRRMEEEGRMLYDGKWWLHDDYRFGDAGFVPKNMSPQELSDAAFEARMRHNALSQIFRRSLDRKTHLKDFWSLATYLAFNPLFRDELLKKHGMMLGYRGQERPAPRLRRRSLTGRKADQNAEAMPLISRVTMGAQHMIETARSHIGSSTDSSQSSR